MTSKHADLLNDLDAMQANPAYVVRRATLRRAERVIVEQEFEVNRLRHLCVGILKTCQEAGPQSTYNPLTSEQMDHLRAIRAEAEKGASDVS